MPFNNPELEDLPDELLSQIIHQLQRFPNETSDFSKAHIRPSLENIYPLFIILYGALIMVGSVSNLAMITHMVHGGLYKRDATCAFLLNLAICNAIMNIFLLPLSVAILLIQNWIFGSFLCYFVPMLQDMPIHATIATLVFVALDRYMRVVHPSMARVSPFIAVLAVWILSVCIVLPYSVYMNYIDLQIIFGKQFEGVGICTVNVGDDISNYIKCLFVVMYVAPLAVCGFLHVRVSSEIKNSECPVSVSTQESREPVSPREPASQQDVFTLQENNSGLSRNLFQDSTRDNSGILSGEMDSREEYQVDDSSHLPSFMTSSWSRTSASDGTPLGHHQGEIASHMESQREKRNQKYLVTITAVIAICIFPLMILRLVKNMVMETYDNSGHFDITFITIVWIAFLPTISTPALFAAWKMPRSTKDRLEGYLRLSNRSQQSSSSAGTHNNQHSFSSCSIQPCHHRAQYTTSLETTHDLPT